MHEHCKDLMNLYVSKSASHMVFCGVLSTVEISIVSFVQDLLKSIFDIDDEEDQVPMKRQRPRPKEKKVVKGGDRTKSSKLILRIYGMDLNAVDSAIADIKEHCDGIRQETVLKSLEVKDAISKLTSKQVLMIHLYLL